MDRQQSNMVSSMVVFVALASLIGNCDAYAFGSTLQHKSFTSSSKIHFTSVNRSTGRGNNIHRENGSAVTLYLFPTPPSISAANHRRPRSGSESSSPVPPPSSTSTSRSTKTKESSSTALPFMSSSVLSPSDTLPSFHTAHGMLSPEVVMRIANTYDGDLEVNGSLHNFLKTYKSKGPMACLGMLSDDEVLPELTRAMREIA